MYSSPRLCCRGRPCWWDEAGLAALRRCLEVLSSELLLCDALRVRETLYLARAACVDRVMTARCEQGDC